MSIELIQTPDTFEVIRDQIAMILADNVAAQMRMAHEAGLDPQHWNLRVYAERSNAWEQFLQTPVVDESPIVNVWFDRSTFDPSASNTVERQKTEAIFNIDCIGYGGSRDNPEGGHHAGDREAALAAHKAVRLCRKFLMSSENTYLQLRGTVWQRWPESVTTFQPQNGERAIQQLVGARIAMRVIFNEFSPQYLAQALERITATVHRQYDGAVIATAEYETTGA